MRRASQARLGDDIRERRLCDCRRTVEEFLVGLARIMAGHEPDLGSCARRSLVARVCRALGPFLASGALLRPDFGTHGELRVDGDLLDAGTPVDAWVEFDDRSMLESDDRLVAAPRRRVRLHLTLAVQPCEVTDLAVRLGAPE
ncbi:MAG TPA: hypothetical protein VF155_08105 [Candidatus Dormibacteraeota bacterium]